MSITGWLNYYFPTNKNRVDSTKKETQNKED